MRVRFPVPPCLSVARTRRARFLYASTMAAIEFTDKELKLLREALKSFLDDFGHEEADTVADIQALLAKLPAQHAA